MAVGSNVEQKGAFNFGVSDFLLTYRQIYKLNSLPTSVIIDQYGDQIRRGLGRRTNTVLTLVCARNEERDLPRLLLGLAQSNTPTQVVVVDNNSTDNTTALATSLGATVITEKNPGLCNALATGFKYIGDSGRDKFLLTDADSLPTQNWVGEMQRGLSIYTRENGGEIFGPIFYYGERVKDTFRSMITFALDLRAKSMGVARAHGPNTAIALDSRGKIITALTSESLPVRDSSLRVEKDMVSDKTVRDIIKQVGGNVVSHIQPRAVVFTRGDRYPSILSIFRAAASEEYKREIIYGAPKH